MDASISAAELGKSLRSSSPPLVIALNFRDDHQMLEHGMVMYDALYAWCRQ